MIQAALEFPLSARELLTKTILSLPEVLRPTSVSMAEDEAAVPISDVDVFLQSFKMPSIGAYLQNSTVLYDLRRSSHSTWIVDADPRGDSRCYGEGFLDSHGDCASDLRLCLCTRRTGIPESHHHDIRHQRHGKLGRARHPEIYSGLILVDVAVGFIGQTTRHPGLHPRASGAGAYRA